MDEIGLCAGRGHGRSDLAGDVAGLADACTDYPALRGQDGRDSTYEIPAQAAAQGDKSVCFQRQNAACRNDMGVIGHAPHVDQIFGIVIRPQGAERPLLRLSRVAS